MHRTYRINSPCSADWNRMSGDDLVRYCPECQRQVYNLAAMQPAEVNQLFANAKGRVCGRLVPPSVLNTENATGNLGAAAGVFAALVTITAANASAAALTEPVASQSQPSKPALAITVQDETGAGIPDASVHLRNQTDSGDFETVTDSSGAVRLSNIPPGVYEITVAAIGFRPASQENVSIPLLRPLLLKVSVGVIGEVIEVSAELAPTSVPAPNTFPAFLGTNPARESTPTDSTPHSTKPISHDLTISFIRPDGTPAAGMELVFTNKDNNEKIVRKTDGHGRVHFKQLPEGSFNIDSTTAVNFVYVSSSLTVASGTPAQVTVKASWLGMMGEVIEVDPNPIHRFFHRLKNIF